MEGNAYNQLSRKTKRSQLFLNFAKTTINNILLF